MNLLAGINKVALIAVLGIIGVAGGFAWYQLQYKPAQALKTSAATALRTAEEAVAAKRAEYENLDKGATDRESVGKMIIAKRAIPRDEDGDEAMVEVELLAKRAGVVFTDVAVSATTGAGGAAIDPTAVVTGAQSVDLTIEAHATYTSLIIFLQQIQGLVDDNRGKVYVKGRLYNVVSLEIGGAEEASAVAEEDALPKGHIKFTLVLRTFAEQPTTPQTTLPGADAAAAAAAGGAAAPADPNAAAAPAAAVPNDPAAAGSSTPGSTTPPAGDASSSAPASSTPSTSTVPPGTS